MENTWFYRFLRRPALLEATRTATFSLHSVFNYGQRPLRSPADYKIFLTGENLAAYPDHRDYGGERYDLALGFEHTAGHPNYLRFPIWLLLCFDPESTFEQIKATVTLWNERRLTIGDRPRRAVLVARHDRSGTRRSIVDAISTVLPVDSAGEFMNTTGTEIAPGWPAKIDLLRQYQYNICPENSSQTGYTTEKLFHAIEAGCIPIYWGWGDAPETNIINKNTILFYDPESPENLIAEVTRLSNQPGRFDAFINRPPLRENAAEVIHTYFTDLEERILALVDN